ncbi:hypothetical protein J6I75_05555 [Pseudidiomarina sp. 1APP75-27a]|uniref:hypothetical protein n=1 Tax=Pseudidiomarina terrestris TaxID=2820060 RepID=UPI002B05B159|nr:hypothetical protein [Pseudidiomarina sp. 1APP75-27a]MEA3587814.1 hypothetical protein [Pseudidiomarina sp. 1APP75-27a]
MFYKILAGVFFIATTVTFVFAGKATAGAIDDRSSTQLKVEVVQRGAELVRIQFDAGTAGDLPLPADLHEIVEPSIIHMVGDKQTTNAERANSIVRHIQYFSQVEPRDFNFYIDSKKTRDGSNFVGFCVDYGETIIHVTCSRAVLDLSTLDFKDLMKKNGIDFKLIQDKAASDNHRVAEALLKFDSYKKAQQSFNL